MTGGLSAVLYVNRCLSINAISERSITYDLNGNILSFIRYGADTAVPKDSLAYSYDGDLPGDISNPSASVSGGEYTHDTKGNPTYDG